MYPLMLIRGYCVIGVSLDADQRVCRVIGVSLDADQRVCRVIGVSLDADQRLLCNWCIP